MTDVHGPGENDIVAPPSGSGITVERGDDGLVVTLPRLYGQGDVIVAVLAAAVALWVGVWLDATASGPGASRLAWLFVAGVGAVFAALALSEAVPILARRVIEDAGDRIVLSRQVGARRVFRKALPKSRIRSVERIWRVDEPGVVEIRVGDDVYRVGKRLDSPALEWLEGVLREMAPGQGTNPAPGAGPPGP
jgi:hypothetical protein